MEGGRLVVDLATFPILAGAGLRLQPAAWPDAVLVVRVSEEHYAAVTGDCPHCGGPVHWEATTDSVLCPRARASFRLDGSLREGAGDLRLRSFPCRRAGPRLEVDLAV
jgi:nitrite reductase/ring-hydroxylating ferredoxin subunit